MHGLLGPGALLQFVIRAVVVLIVIPFHEAAHALASDLLGDPTAKYAGRLSLNPLHHFDLLGTLCMILGGIGWAKPVGINPARFRNPKVGMALSAAAGPAANLLLAWGSTVLYKLVYYSLTGSAANVLLLFLWYMISMNISLAVFNLLPVPPFDGSRIALLFLPQKAYFKAMRYEQFIMFGVFALVLLGVLDAPLSIAVNAVWRGMLQLTGFVELLLFGV